MTAHHTVNLAVVRKICHQLFYYRHKQPWPAHIEKGDGWQTAYDTRRGNLDVIPSVDDAITWAQSLVDKIERAEQEPASPAATPYTPLAESTTLARLAN